MSLALKAAKQLGVSQGLDALDAEVLLAHLLAKPRTFLYTWPEHELTATELEQLNDYYARRLQGEPVAYILGEREFWSLMIKTSPSTLIPRPDTEVLVEAVLAKFDEQPCRCIDLGTGTGAIALALKSERPAWQISAVDRIEDAVNLAKTNAAHLNFDIQVSQQNWLAGMSPNSMDLIVSNPPYIDADDEHLAEGDVRFEPKSALVAEHQGLADIEIITQQAAEVLVKGGALFFEHGWQQGSAVREILAKYGFAKIETVQDYGGNDRVSFGFLLGHL